MKKSLVLIFGMSVLFGTVSAQDKKELRKEKRVAELERVVQQMEKIMTDNEFVFEPNQYVTKDPGISGRLPSQNLVGYFLKIVDEKLYVSLPFFGNVTRPTLGGASMNFETEHYVITAEPKPKNKGWDILVTTQDEKQNQTYRFSLDVMPTGNALLICDAPGRDYMKFYGTIVLSK